MRVETLRAALVLTLQATLQATLARPGARPRDARRHGPRVWPRCESRVRCRASGHRGEGVRVAGEVREDRAEVRGGAVLGRGVAGFLAGLVRPLARVAVPA
jgi:hypothetical protein